MATTRRKLKIERQDGGQGRPAASKQNRSDGAQQQRGGRTQSGVKQSARKPGGLLNMNAEQLARGLGFFSLGLGLSEFLAPRGLWGANVPSA